MHCPHCRQDNATTTRFCTFCGAVLVEEAPGGGRRRVLRPWGLRRSAPPTVSPDFPEYEVPAIAKAAGARSELWLAAGVIGVVALLAGVHSWRTPASEAAPVPRTMLAAAPVAEVAVQGVTQTRETRLAAPALVEMPAAVPPRRADEPHPPAPLAVPPAPRLGGPRGVAGVPVTYVAPVREAVIGDGRSAEPAAVSEPAPASEPTPAPDRWQMLREALARCTALGVLERAVCEQGARLAHCEGYWGHAAACPAGRTEFGQ